MTAAPPFADAVRSRLISQSTSRRARTKKPVVTLYQMRKLNGVIMPGRLVDTGGWIIVCDGAKALILENVGDRKFPNLRTREVHQQETPKTQELGTDAPGRAHQSVGAARSSVEQTDWHEQSEQRFLIALAGRLDRAAESGETKALIVVAPSRALGVLRKHYTPKLKTVLRGEIERDYVNLPVPEIEARLAA